MLTCRGGGNVWARYGGAEVEGREGQMEEGERLKHRFPFVYLRCKRRTVCAG